MTSSKEEKPGEDKKANPSSSYLRVSAHSQLLKAILKAASEENVYAIARLQDREDRDIVINNGKVERIVSAVTRGVGVQVFTDDGYTGFASADVLSEDVILPLVHQAAALARASRQFNADSNKAIFDIPSAETIVSIPSRQPLRDTAVAKMQENILKANQEALARDPDLSIRSSFGITDEEWRIVRSDGTDVSFCTPHASAGHVFTAKDGSDAHTTGARVSGSDERVMFDPVYSDRLIARSHHAADLARDLLTAPRIKAGPYKLVIDYALAKGLAHEAFGHAAETDNMSTSILGKDGLIRLGEELAAPHVNIIDGPIEGDYAYQPYSANGNIRQTVEILRHGVLTSGLADAFSAVRAGSPLTGAERAESFRSIPLPRMSNIRIVLDKVIPLETPFEQVTPTELRHILITNDLIAPDETVLFLSGYRGGQVNPKEGDFVFNCASIYLFTNDESLPPPLYLPAIFSGKVLSALRSIVTGIGPLYLDAMGTCGKGGQSVPSSGGAHAYVVIDRNPDIIIGGE